MNPLLLPKLLLAGLPPVPGGPLPALPVSESTGFRLSGDVGNEHERRPFTLEFDPEGRFRADYSRSLFPDACFDGRRVEERDPAGRVHELLGWQRDTSLLLHGLLCGNWRGALAGWHTTTVEEDGGSRTLRLRPGERPFEALLSVDPRSGHPLRATFRVLGREQSLVFEGWRDGEAGAFAPVVRLEADGLPLGEYRLERLEAARVEDGFELAPEEPEGVELSAEADGELEVRVLPSGHAFVRASVDDEEPAWFLFDTGASNTVLDEALARRIRFDPVVDAGNATGVGGQAAFRLGRVERLEVGPLRIRRALVAASDLSGLRGVFGLELAGILGADVLVHATWLYDLPQARIAVLRGDEVAELDPTWIPARRNEGQLLVPAGFEGHEGWFVLDTAGGGVPVTFHHPTSVRYELLRDRPTRPIGATGLAGATSMPSGRIQGFELAGRDHGEVLAIFGPDEGVWSDPYVDGLVGIWLLRQGGAILDYPHDRVGLVPHGDDAPDPGEGVR